MTTELSVGQVSVRIFRLSPSHV